MYHDEFVSKSEFAAMNGWKPPYVTKLVKTGRLVMSEDGKRVNASASLKKLAETADLSKVGVQERWQRERAIGGEGLISASDGGPEAAATRSTFNTAKAKRESHMASLAELELMTKLGQLVRTDRVVQALTDNAAAMRAALERIPDRISGILAAETDPNKVYQLLDNEIGNVLDDLSRLAESMPDRIIDSMQ